MPQCSSADLEFLQELGQDRLQNIISTHNTAVTASKLRSYMCLSKAERKGMSTLESLGTIGSIKGSGVMIGSIDRIKSSASCQNPTSYHVLIISFATDVAIAGSI